MRSSDPKPSRYSCRGEARKEVDYNTRRHPQDKDLAGILKRRRLTQREDDRAGRSNDAMKRSKVSEDEVARGHT